MTKKVKGGRVVSPKSVSFRTYCAVLLFGVERFLLLVPIESLVHLESLVCV